jgi:RNA polymerase sigma-70 factor (ECF subfamily)
VDYSDIPPSELLSLCANSSDAVAWEEFIRRFHPLIASIVIRVARHWGESSRHVIDDLIQDTYLKLCSDRANLSGRFTSGHKDAAFGYIKVLTANLVHDHFKASHSQKRDCAVTTSIDTPAGARQLEGATPPLAGTLERTVLLQEIDSCLQIISPGSEGRRDRLIFWLYYRVGLPASAIAALPAIGLTTKGVESTLMRLTKQVRQRLVLTKSRGSVPGVEGEGIQSAESL